MRLEQDWAEAEAVAWAAEAGAQTVVVGQEPVEGCQADYVITHLAELPDLLMGQGLAMTR